MERLAGGGSCCAEGWDIATGAVIVGCPCDLVNVLPGVEIHGGVWLKKRLGLGGDKITGVDKSDPEVLSLEPEVLTLEPEASAVIETFSRTCDGMLASSWSFHSPG